MTECWLCHRKQDELLQFAKDKTKCSDDLSELIFGIDEEKGDVFLEVDVFGTKVDICPVCFSLVQNMVLEETIFEEKFDEMLSNYQIQISGHLVAKEKEDVEQ